VKAVADAALATMRAAWNSTQVHGAGSVPALAQTPYIVIYADGGRDDGRMLDGTAGLDAFRLMPMAVGKTEDELNRAVDRIRGAFRGKRLPVAGYDTTPIVIESSGGTVRDPDGGGLLSKTLFLTFHMSPKENP
jgi:hypothetical protein